MAQTVNVLPALQHRPKTFFKHKNNVLFFVEMVLEHGSFVAECISRMNAALWFIFLCFVSVS